MSASPLETLVRDYIDVVFNRHELGDLTAYWHEDLTSHWMGQRTLHGLPEWRQGMEQFFTAFPDIRYRLDDLFFDDDRGVWRGSWRGTQRGDWAGVAASGRTAEWSAVIIARFSAGRLVEDWVEYDRLGLYRQLGAVPVED